MHMKKLLITTLALLTTISINGASDKKTSPKNATKTLASATATAATTSTATAAASKPCGKCVKCTGVCGRCNIYPCVKEGPITYGLCRGCMFEKGYEQA